MKYWDDMQEKWGFSDGEAVPAGAELYRKVYVTAVNRAAEKLGSAVRAVAFDRAGMHNWCLIYFASAEATAQHSPDSLADGSAPDLSPDFTVDVDEAMNEAIDIAQTACLDDLVRVHPELADGWQSHMDELLKAAEGEVE